jgi:hypothetical protein
MKLAKMCTLAAVAALGACSGAQDELGEESVGTQGEEIIRATSLGGRNEVVMIFAVVNTPEGTTTLTCSGSYFAPRVVLTAAHCLENIVDANVLNTRPQLFVYFGDNFAQDFGQLTPSGAGFSPPPIGSPSQFAQADSFETHPSWDPALIHPDMGAVYLDRKPPFDPLPLLRSRVGSGVQVTISGWGANSAPTPTTGAGGQVQRTGPSRTLGSPTAADYHPEDPNPGMLNATVRQNVIKLDGRAPNANSCFGDSGGPMLVRQSGQDYIAGVSYFGGLSCEDYSLYVRIDPFLPFVDKAYKRGGQDVLRPTFNCVTPNPQGTLTAHFGYRNDNGVAVTIPYGAKNSAPRDTSGTRPTLFYPGSSHTFSAAIDFAPGQTASWTLSPDNNPTTTVSATSSSPRCSSGQFVQTEAALACRAIGRSGCPAFNTYAQCSEGTAEFNQFIADVIPQCVPSQSALFNCIGAGAPGVANWNCDAGLPTACFPAFDAYLTCLSG